MYRWQATWQFGIIILMLALLVGCQSSVEGVATGASEQDEFLEVLLSTGLNETFTLSAPNEVDLGSDIPFEAQGIDVTGSRCFLFFGPANPSNPPLNQINLDTLTAIAMPNASNNFTRSANVLGIFTYVLGCLVNGQRQGAMTNVITSDSPSAGGGGGTEDLTAYQTLVPGSGWDGINWPPPPGGSGNAIPAADFMTVDHYTKFENGDECALISIAAFHPSRINRVEFRSNGGAILTETVQKLDTDLAYHHFPNKPYELISAGHGGYVVKICGADHVDGRYEVRARVIANGNFPARNLKFIFWANANGTLPREELYVHKNSGNDSNPGTRTSPKRTVKGAINALASLPASQAGGAYIYLMGVGNQYGIGGNTARVDNNRPITITYDRLDSAVSPHSIEMTPRRFSPSDEYIKARMIRYEGLKVVPSSNTYQNYTHLNDGVLILDNLYMTAEGTGAAQNVSGGGVSQLFGASGPNHYNNGKNVVMVNSVLYDFGRSVTHGIGKMVNTSLEKIGANALKNVFRLFGIHVFNTRTNAPTDHADLFHIAGSVTEANGKAPIIFYNSSVRDGVGQPLFTDDHNGAGVPIEVENMAMVNCLAEHHQPGSHRIDLGAEEGTNYTVIAQTAFPWNGGGFRFTPDGSAWFANIIRDFNNSPSAGLEISPYGHNTVFDSWNPLNDGQNEPGPQFAGWTWSDNSNAVWINPDGDDFRPAVGSPLNQKVPVDELHARFDMLGNLRGENTGMSAVGPFAGPNE